MRVVFYSAFALATFSSICEAVKFSSLQQLVEIQSKVELGDNDPTKPRNDSRTKKETTQEPPASSSKPGKESCDCSKEIDTASKEEQDKCAAAKENIVKMNKQIEENEAKHKQDQKELNGHVKDLQKQSEDAEAKSKQLTKDTEKQVRELERKAEQYERETKNKIDQL